MGWAVMQTPFWTIDYACHPDADKDLHRKILAWADRRARKALSTVSGRDVWLINIFAGQTDRMRDLEEVGFACQADVGENSWSKVLMRRSPQTPLTTYEPRGGCVVRSLAGVDEVKAYVELHRSVFESKNMTVRWRRRTLRRPEYIPDLDVVVAAPDGRLVAFCICWLDTSSGPTPSGRIEPLGCHKDFRKYALGRVALTEGLRRLQAHGAQNIYVETDSFRNTAFALYESVGFEVIQDVLVYRKDYA
jgi:ribosomal protein S18 acetylase RimI-like enzyme